MVIGTEAPSTSSRARKDSAEEKRDEHIFECNICLDTAKEAVVSMCGHLFCWPCLHQWLDIRPNKQVCPVCKAGISKDKVIPLYGRGSTSQDDPRNKTPPRPPGQRSEHDNNVGFPGFGFGEGNFLFGIGAFPFGFISSSFSFSFLGGERTSTGQRGANPPFEGEQFISNAFVWVAIVFICCLLIA